MTRFSETLEDLARELSVGPREKFLDPSIPATIRREITLLLDQIDRQKASHAIHLRELLRTECTIDTDLMQLEQRIPRYTPYHFPEKEKLKQRLCDLEKDRRQLDLRHQEKLHALEDHLLTLIHKHQQLEI